MNNVSQQKGFALVVVLVSTLIASTVVLTSLKDTTVQERLSGNLQKKLNARMAADKGIYDAMESMTEQLKLAGEKSLTLEELVAKSFDSGAMSEQFEMANSTMTYDVVINTSADDSSLAANELSITSAGTYSGGKSEIKAIYEIVSSSTLESFPFANGITGCEAVTVSGSGLMDSYNSVLGAYGTTLDDGNLNKNANFTLRTLYNDSGQVEFTGAASINGDMIATGDINYKGKNVTGSMQSNGNITIDRNDVMDGNVISRKAIAINQMAINGYVLGLGDISLTRNSVLQGVSTHGNYQQVQGTIAGGVYVAGDVYLDQANIDSLTYAGSYSTGNTSNVSNSEKVNSVSINGVSEAPYDDKIRSESDPIQTTCDPFDIASKVSAINEQASSADDFTLYANEVYVLSKSSAYFSSMKKAHSTETVTAVANVDFIGSNNDVLMFNNISLNNGELTVKEGEDVTMYIKGNFSMSGSSTLTIPENSSLTLIVQGIVDLAGGGNIETPVSGVTESGLPVLSIFSAYKGSGFILKAGNKDVYATVYAPLTDLFIQSSASFKGALHGNSITVSGNGQVTYDEALGNTGPFVTSSGGSTKIVFKGWEYVTEGMTVAATETAS